MCLLPAPWTLWENSKKQYKAEEKNWILDACRYILMGILCILLVHLSNCVRVLAHFSRFLDGNPNPCWFKLRQRLAGAVSAVRIPDPAGASPKRGPRRAGPMNRFRGDGTPPSRGIAKLASAWIRKEYSPHASPVLPSEDVPRRRRRSISPVESPLYSRRRARATTGKEANE